MGHTLRRVTWPIRDSVRTPHPQQLLGELDTLPHPHRHEPRPRKREPDEVFCGEGPFSFRRLPSKRLAHFALRRTGGFLRGPGLRRPATRRRRRDHLDIRVDDDHAHRIITVLPSLVPTLSLCSHPIPSSPPPPSSSSLSPSSPSTPAPLSEAQDPSSPSPSDPCSNVSLFPNSHIPLFTTPGRLHSRPVMTASVAETPRGPRPRPLCLEFSLPFPLVSFDTPPVPVNPEPSDPISSLHTSPNACPAHRSNSLTPRACEARRMEASVEGGGGVVRYDLCRERGRRKGGEGRGG
ncbi:hypothetical protein FA13DRAFT_1287000 [Coprinellus micaceus]|uniref:Uncharacterized protein n=1 Tax=Coprinellus micaceus TaxID=71717 RepID=A0A4Y7SSK6_COPMI|nr:hypothetical protein FA13DRAFT_1287000 [Coprinellus micaceus]